MSTKPLIGCIADDFTGATDLANQFVRAGLRVVQTIGVPDVDSVSSLSRYDVLVVALKSRTIASGEAVRQSLNAYDWLQRLGCQQFYFKVCSTFDSTPQGNIGPVTEALIEATGEDLVLVTPAFPENLRSVYQGYLFVGSQLLHETGMRDHPLTPMTDSNLVRVLQAQTALPVGLISHAVVSQGPEAVRARMQSLRAEGYRMAIGDAVSNHDLMVLGSAVHGRRLVTAGSGLAIGLPQNFSFSPLSLAEAFPRPSGACAVVSGSCSQATQRQVRAFMTGGGQAWRIDPLSLHSQQAVVEGVLRWAEPRIGQAPILVYSTASPEEVAKVQDRLGIAEAGSAIEQALAQVARGLVQRGVGQLVVAGGETSGACVQALGVRELEIGPQIDPGVPWCFVQGGGPRHEGLHLALKSGNFGTDDFFMKAFERLAHAAASAGGRVA